MPFGGIVLKAWPLASTNLVLGGASGAPGRTFPSSRVAMLVPYPPGV
jgi:hypothetical protein